MKNDYYPDIDENFNRAIGLFEKELSHEEIITLLKNGNIVEKQIAALRFDEPKNENDAIVLVKNLIGCDGKIREAVSLKINELKSNKYLHQKEIYDIFLEAVIDINSNICRNIITTINELKSDEDFCKYFIPKLIYMTQKLVDTVSKFDFQEGKYKVNKEVFKLYWCLETIYNLAEKIDTGILKNLLSTTKDIDEYTIREKTAKILSKDINNEELNLIKQQLKEDKNYYVRRF